jgi:hypothetical protein
LLEHLQVRDCSFGESEGRKGNQSASIVDERDQVGLTHLACFAELESVYDVAHPQVAGALVLKAAMVFDRGLALPFLHQTAARQEAVHGGLGEHDLAHNIMVLLARHPEQRGNAR